VHTHTMGGQDQPVWTVAFNRHEGSGGQCFLSGGDDCCMRLWDVRAGHTTPVMHLGLGRRYMYDAGVTSAQWHPEQKHILATGSYDEHVRIWDDRALATPLHKVHTGKQVEFVSLFVLFLFIMQSIYIYYTYWISKYFELCVVVKLSVIFVHFYVCNRTTYICKVEVYGVPNGQLSETAVF